MIVGQTKMNWENSEVYLVHVVLVVSTNFSNTTLGFKCPCNSQILMKRE